MLAHFRYLILAVLVLILTVMDCQKTSAAPENQEKPASPLLKSFEDSRRNPKCIAPGKPCNSTCDCCPVDFQYLCTKSKQDGKRYCTAPFGPPHSCPNRPCRPIQGSCTRECDCCQKDEQGNNAAVNCYIEQSAQFGKCRPQPFVIEDCVRPPPPPPKA